MTGIVPASFDSAVVKPLHKKAHLDPGSLNHFRQVSNLPLKRAVSQQLSGYLHNNNNLLEPFKSAFRVSLHQNCPYLSGKLHSSYFGLRLCLSASVTGSQ